jgi:hypothetical protein
MIKEKSRDRFSIPVAASDNKNSFGLPFQIDFLREYSSR